MKQRFDDILEAAGKPPLWWDEAGTPRFCEFHPQHVNDPYACEGYLLRIACQGCHKEYLVSVSWNHTDLQELFAYMELSEAKAAGKEPPPTAWPAIPLSERLADGHYPGYGDPPHACDKDCAAGYSMTTYTLAIEQAWVRERWNWKRRPDLERVFPSMDEQIREDIAAAYEYQKKGDSEPASEETDG